MPKLPSSSILQWSLSQHCQSPHLQKDSMRPATPVTSRLSFCCWLGGEFDTDYVSSCCYFYHNDKFWKWAELPKSPSCRLQTRFFVGYGQMIFDFTTSRTFFLSKIRIWKIWSTPYSTSYLMLLTTKDHFPQTLLTTLMCCKASETVFHSNVRKENKNSSSSSFIPSSFCEETRVGHAHSISFCPFIVAKVKYSCHKMKMKTDY